MTVVLDASVAVGALLVGGELGAWCEARLAEPVLMAPHLMPAEVSNTLRRRVAAGQLSAATAGGLLCDLEATAVDLYPFEPFRDRVWELRENLTAYDAWYVALAEAHDCPLATLDPPAGRGCGRDVWLAHPRRVIGTRVRSQHGDPVSDATAYL